MEPLFSLEDERAMLPPELHRPLRHPEPVSRSPRRDDEDQRDESGTGSRTQRDERQSPQGAPEEQFERSTGREGGSGGTSSRRNGGSPGKSHLDRHLVHVVTQYYLAENPRRAREIDSCLLKNLRNDLVGSVHLLTDHPDAVPRAARPPMPPLGGNAKGQEESELEANHRPEATRATSSDVRGRKDAWERTDWIPPILRGLEAKLAGKVTVVALGRRMTFQDAIGYSNTVLNSKVVVLANSDIFFDGSLSRLGDPATLDMRNRVYALTTWESELDPLSAGGGSDDDFKQERKLADAQISVFSEPKFIPRIDSQDAWIFRSPLVESVVSATDFEMGRPRCDGRLAQVLTDGGYHVTNPCLSLIAHHVHSTAIVVANASAQPAAPSNSTNDPGTRDGHRRLSQKQTTYRGDTQVAGKTAFVAISDQWLF